jgi:hypothetical protein
MTDNTLCGWMEGHGQRQAHLPEPAERQLQRVWDPRLRRRLRLLRRPLTGDAVPSCRVVFGGGGTACVLYCANGQTCPDGMACASGYCYWPD